MEREKLYPRVSFPVLCDWIFVQPDSSVDAYTCTLCDTEGIKKSNSPGNLIKHCSGLKCVGFTYRGSTHPRNHQDLQPIYKLYAEWRTSRSFTNELGFQREVSPFAKQLHAWIDIVVKCNMPLSVCENEIMRSHISVKGMSRKTLRKVHYHVGRYRRTGYSRQDRARLLCRRCLVMRRRTLPGHIPSMAPSPCKRPDYCENSPVVVRPVCERDFF